MWHQWSNDNFMKLCTVADRAQRAANRKNACKLRKNFANFTTNALQMLTTQPNKQMYCKYSQHNQTKKRICCKYNSLFGCVVSICSTCFQTDEDVFLICWSFFYLHVFSEVAAHWALLATFCAQRKQKWQLYSTFLLFCVRLRRDTLVNACWLTQKRMHFCIKTLFLFSLHTKSFPIAS